MPKFNEASAIIRSTLGLRRLTPATRQGQLIVKACGIVTGLACALHLVLGANPIEFFSTGVVIILLNIWRKRSALSR